MHILLCLQIVFCLLEFVFILECALTMEFGLPLEHRFGFPSELSFLLNIAECHSVFFIYIRGLAWAYAWGSRVQKAVLLSDYLVRYSLVVIIQVVARMRKTGFELV